MFDVNIHVRLDLRAAADSLALSRDQRRWIDALYQNPDFSERQAGEFLGWDAKRVEAVARSLSVDRPDGRALRAFLGAYRPPHKNNENSSSQKIQFGLTMESEPKTKVRETVWNRLRTLFTPRETEEQIEADLRRRLRLAQLPTERDESVSP